MQIPLEKIDRDALRVVERLRAGGFEAFLVGGCVRDLLLGRRPKDFDVATSATPNEIRRVFRNCRIIGRRFRLAHVFFGQKIIETATFRANPRPTDDEENEVPTEAEEKETRDLYVRRDNVFGTAEEDARRRDFTVNGLFFDPQKNEVIDYVAGVADLEARIVRTIGDPDVRFREDPVRILRAVKFAARCDLTIEPETLRRMIEHKAEITRCPMARVSEELFRLFRAGAARRSIELLIETGLGELLLPELSEALGGEPAGESDGRRRARFWAYLSALDAKMAERPAPASNALVLATFLLPDLRDALDPDSTGVGDIGKRVADVVLPFAERIRASRRDTELARQILMAMRFLLPTKRDRPRRRPNLRGRDFFADASLLAEIVTALEGQSTEVAAQPVAGELSPEEARAEEAAAAELENAEPERAPRGQPQRGEPRRDLPSTGAPPSRSTWMPSRDLVATPIPTVRFYGPPPLPAFLGDGSFGGRWAASE